MQLRRRCLYRIVSFGPARACCGFFKRSCLNMCERLWRRGSFLPRYAFFDARSLMPLRILWPSDCSPPPQSHPEQRIKLLYHLLDLPSVPLAKMTNFGGRSTPTKRYRDDVAHGHAKLMRRSDSEFQAVIYEANGRQYICKRLSTLMSIPLLPFMNRSRWTCAYNAPRSRID
jgi:hypothetical protein